MKKGLDNSRPCHLSTGNQKILIFLAWIGKHDPVTSSTIDYRWLKTCLSDAGIDTGICKAHSVGGGHKLKSCCSWNNNSRYLTGSGNGHVKVHFKNSIIRYWNQQTNHPLRGQSCHLLRHQTCMLIWKWSLPEWLRAHEKGDQHCLHAIRNYMRYR